MTFVACVDGSLLHVQSEVLARGEHLTSDQVSTSSGTAANLDNLSVMIL